MSRVSDADAHSALILINCLDSGLRIKSGKNIYQPEIPMADLQAKSKLLLFLQTAKILLLVFGGENVEQAKTPPLLSFELSASETRTGRDILFQLRVTLRKARGLKASSPLAPPPS